MKQDKITKRFLGFETHDGGKLSDGLDKTCELCGLRITKPKVRICEYCKWKKKMGQL